MSIKRFPTLFVESDPYATVFMRCEPFIHCQTFNVTFHPIPSADSLVYTEMLENLFYHSDLDRFTNLPSNATLDIDLRFSFCRAVNVKCKRQNFNVKLFVDKLTKLVCPPLVFSKIHIRVDRIFNV